MATFADDIANYATGKLLRGMLYPPGGAFAGGTGIAYSERATATGWYHARATVTVANTSFEPTLLVVKEVLTQDDAGFAASNVVVYAGPYLHAYGGNFVDIAPGLFTAGFGPLAVVIHVTDGTSALGGATVRLADGAAANVSSTTDSSGNATLNVSAGTYTLSVAKDGYTYTATSQVVSAAGTINVAMSLVVIPSPTTVAQTVGVITCYDAYGAVVVGAIIECEIVSGPGTTGASFSRTLASATSGAGGVTYVMLPKDCMAKARRDGGPWTDAFSTGTASSITLPEVLGRPRN